MTIIDAVRKQIMHDRKNHRQWRQYTLILNEATAYNELDPYKALARDPSPLSFAWGHTTVQRDDTLPDNFAVLIVHVPASS